MKYPHLLLNGLATVLFLCYCAAGTALAQNASFKWALQSGYGGYPSYATGVAVDPAGNVLVTGGLYTSGNGGFFLDKYTAGGATRRALEIMSQNLVSGGEAFNPQYTTVAVDGTGNVFVLGKFGATLGGTAYFGGLALPATPTMFLEKFDTNLNRLWLATSQGNPCGNVALNVDQNGNSLVLFSANGPATLGGIAVDSAGAFLASFDPAGDCLSVRMLVTNSFQVALVASVSATNVLTWLPIPPQGAIANFSTNGDLLWIQQFGGSGSADIAAIASDTSGNAYIVGQLRNGDVALGSMTISNPGTLFVAKLDAMGNPLWALEDSLPSHAFPSTIVADSSGNCFIAGSINADETLGTTTLHWQSDYDWMQNMFAAAVSSDGQWLWAKQDWGSLTDLSCLALDPSGHLYVAGEAANTLHFDSIVLSVGSPQKAYVTRIDPPTPPTLSLSQAGGQIILSWPTNQAGFTLQSAVNLGPSAAWMDVADLPAILGLQFVVTNTVSDAARFYRLKK